MSANVETMAYVNEVPWHGIGTKVGNVSARKMLEKAGLDWKVEKQQLMTEGGIRIPDRYAIIRDKDNAPLSVCSGSFHPVQNEEVFDFFAKFVRAGKMKMETAGSLANGKRIWGLARMEHNDFDVVKNDPVESYLLLANSHEPGMALTMMFTPIRVVCQNTLAMAMNKATTANADRIFKMSHKTVYEHDQIKALAEDVLGLSDNAMGSFKEKAKILASRRATAPKIKEFFKDLYQPDLVIDDSLPMDEIGFHPTVEKLITIFDEQPGAELTPGTWWNAVNAVTYFHDHVKGRTVDSRMNASWFGTGRTKKEEALHLAMEYAKDSRKA